MSATVPLRVAVVTCAWSGPWHKPASSRMDRLQRAQVDALLLDHGLRIIRSSIRPLRGRADARAPANPRKVNPRLDSVITIPEILWRNHNSGVRRQSSNRPGVILGRKMCLNDLIFSDL